MSGVALVPAHRRPFRLAAGRGRRAGRPGLPPGGVDEPWVLQVAAPHPADAWRPRQLADGRGRRGGRPVQLQGRRQTPEGDVEIGYARRARSDAACGHATRAVALLIEAARLRRPRSARSRPKPPSPTCRRSRSLDRQRLRGRWPRHGRRRRRDDRLAAGTFEAGANLRAPRTSARASRGTRRRPRGRPGWGW